MFALINDRIIHIKLKKMNIVKFIPVLAFIACMSCNKNEPSPAVTNSDAIPTTINTSNPSILKCDKEIVDASNTFGFHLLQKINNETADNENIFISPSSVSIALALTANGANGETRDELLNALGFQGKSMEVVDEHFMNFTKTVSSLDPQAQLSIANSLWPADWLSVDQAFIDVSTKYFDAETRPLDFSDPNANDTINAWVEDKTNDRIKDILHELDASVAMVIANAIYFKADWSVEFNEENTHETEFTTTDGSKTMVDMMSRSGKIDYYTNETMQAVELFYGDSTFSMVIMLPTEHHSTDEIIASLNDENWNTMNNSFVSEEIAFYLPKTKIEWKDNIARFIKAFGVNKAFGDADFSNITNSVGLFVDEIIHQSFLEVNEKGSEAAAATVVVIRYESVQPEPIMFRADKPFVLAIKENNTNSVLFLGEVNKP